MSLLADLNSTIPEDVSCATVVIRNFAVSGFLLFFYWFSVYFVTEFVIGVKQFSVVLFFVELFIKLDYSALFGSIFLLEL